MKRRFTPEEARAAGRKGGTINGRRRWHQTLTRIKALWPWMSHEAALAVHAYGETRYRSGWRARDRRDAV